MKSSAKNLDFEEAARYRDLIKELKDKVLIIKHNGSPNNFLTR